LLTSPKIRYRVFHHHFFFPSPFHNFALPPSNRFCVLRMGFIKRLDPFLPLSWITPLPPAYFPFRRPLPMSPLISLSADLGLPKQLLLLVSFPRPTLFVFVFSNMADPPSASAWPVHFTSLHTCRMIFHSSLFSFSSFPSVPPLPNSFGRLFSLLCLRGGTRT